MIFKATEFIVLSHFLLFVKAHLKTNESVNTTNSPLNNTFLLFRGSRSLESSDEVQEFHLNDITQIDYESRDIVSTPQDPIKAKHHKSFTFNNDISASEGRIQSPRSRLEAFIQRLKSFIGDTFFDDAGFEPQIKELTWQISDIDIWLQVENLVQHISEASNFGDGKLTRNPLEIKQVSDQLRFAKYMFRLMANSVQTLRFYNERDNVGHNLVKCLAQLNVRLLALRNKFGVPDPSIRGFSKTLILHNLYLTMYKHTHDSLKNEPADVTKKFTQQYTQAKNTLQIMERYKSM